MLIHEMLEGHAERTPEKEAMALRDRRVSYGEYLEAVNRVAANLVKLGVKRGDKVALYIGNSPDYVFCYIATVSLAPRPFPSRRGSSTKRQVSWSATRTPR